MTKDTLEWFYGWGIDGDPFHMPWPHRLQTGPAPNQLAVFKERLIWSPRHWEFTVNGNCLLCNFDDSWRTWNTGAVEVSTENWNQGDQLGGRPANGSDPGNKQKFRSISWNDQIVTHTGDLGGVGQSGHCFPWVSSQTFSSSDFDVWTNNNHTNC